MGNKIQRIYVGDHQLVYPEYLYKYEYDFRNKTVAICQADGWSFVTTSGVTINSDGLNYSGSMDNYAKIYCTPSGLTTALSRANKVIMEMMFYKGSAVNAGSQNVFYLAGPSSYTSNGTGFGAGGETIGGSSVYSIVMRALATDKFRNQYTVAYGTYTQKVVMDFVNKTMEMTYGDIMNTTQSLTDAEITTIRTLKYLRIGVMTPAVIKTIGFIIK